MATKKPTKKNVVNGKRHTTGLVRDLLRIDPLPITLRPFLPSSTGTGRTGSGFIPILLSHLFVTETDTIHLHVDFDDDQRRKHS